MSVRAVSWAYGLNLGSMTQKAVLLYLAYRAREEDNCAWPSVNLSSGDRIARTCRAQGVEGTAGQGTDRIGRSGTRGGRLSWRRRFP